MLDIELPADFEAELLEYCRMHGLTTDKAVEIAVRKYLLAEDPHYSGKSNGSINESNG
jgi:hypothetical protein